MEIIKRIDWLQKDDRPAYQKHKPTRIVIHHSYIPTTAQFNGDASIRSIWNYHTKNKGWADIAYQYLISPDGSAIYEGRPADAIGAHCGGNPPAGIERNFGNTGSVGICLIGDYDHETPDPEALKTLRYLIADLCEKWQIDSRNIFGHCEAWSKAPKTCPGKNLYVNLFGEQRWKALKF